MGVIIMNKVILGDCVEVMKTLKDNSIDLTVTSPPYDQIRDYNGFKLDLEGTGKELYRITKDGGIVVMVMQDQTKNFGKSLTTFKTAIQYVELGFKLFECCIYQRAGVPGAWWSKRFRVDHEYILIFLKGKKPNYFNKPMIPCKHAGKTVGVDKRLTSGEIDKKDKILCGKTKCRGTIWDISATGEGNKLKCKHPATFPDKLASDIIECFCPHKGIVLDPYCGSGTTCVASKKLDRKYIGIDISKEYCDIAKQRIQGE